MHVMSQLCSIGSLVYSCRKMTRRDANNNNPARIHMLLPVRRLHSL